MQDAKKSEVQIRELQKTIEQLTLENARKAEETAKDKGIDKDKHIMELEEEVMVAYPQKIGTCDRIIKGIIKG